MTTTETASTVNASAEQAAQAERAHAARVRELANKAEPAVAAPPQRGGAGMLVAGGVLAAVIGAGATIWALPHLPPQISGLLAQPDSGIDATLNDQSRKITDMEQQIRTLANRPDPAPVAAPDMSGVQAALDETSAQLRALTTRVDALEQRPATVTNTVPTNIQTEIEALRAQIGSLSTENISARVNAAADQAETRLKQSELQASELQTKAQQAAERVISQSLTARLATAFDAGIPLDGVIKEAQDAGMTLPDALLAQIPTLNTLQMDFPEAARLALAASRRSEATSGGMWQKLEALVKTQLGARYVTPQQGDGADAVLSRAAAAVEAGNIPQAVTELSALPQAGQDAIAGWVAMAQARMAAGAAITDLSTAAK